MHEPSAATLLQSIEFALSTTAEGHDGGARLCICCFEVGQEGLHRRRYRWFRGDDSYGFGPPNLGDYACVAEVLDRVLSGVAEEAGGCEFGDWICRGGGGVVGFCALVDGGEPGDFGGEVVGAGYGAGRQTGWAEFSGRYMA